MESDVYVISCVGDYETYVIGVYTTLEDAKQKLAKIAANCVVVSYGYENLSFTTTTGDFYCIDETILYT